MVLVEIILPPGSVPGQRLQVQLGAQTVTIVIPPNTGPGTTIAVDVPDHRAAPPPLPAPPAPQPQQGGEVETEGIEKVGVLVATVVGFFGVIAALVMLHNLDIGVRQQPSHCLLSLPIPNCQATLRNQPPRVF